jgi:two-component system phosphate regulon sensor histidine kinase PhoR
MIAVLLFLSSMMVAGLYFFTYRQQMYAQVEQDLKRQIQIWHVMHAGGLAARAKTNQSQQAMVFDRMTIIDNQGKVLLDTKKDPNQMDNHALRPEVLQAGQKTWATAKRYSDTMQAPSLYVAQQIQENGQTYTIRAARSIKAINEKVYALLGRLVLVQIGVLILSMMFLYFVLRRPLHDVAHIQHVVQRYQQGDLTPRTNIKSTGEIKELASGIDYMADAVQQRMEHLSNSQQKLHQILDSLQDGLVIMKNNAEIEWFNRAFQNIMQLPNLANHQVLTEQVRHAEIVSLINEVAHHGKPAKTVCMVEEEKTQYLLFHAFPIDLQTTRMLALSVTDTTTAHATNRAKHEFIANASHQLKTPLAAIQGFAETMMDLPHLTESKRASYLQKIIERSKAATAMIIRLLTLTKIEGGASELDIRPVDLHTFINEVVASQEGLATSSQVQINTMVKGDVLAVETDDRILDIAVSSLLENAIVYSPRGGVIELKVKREHDKICIQIADQGIGFDAEQKKRIFERFYRTPEAQNAHQQGTGIGLALVQQAVERLEGQLSIESEKGQGSVFEIRFPA